MVNLVMAQTREEQPLSGSRPQGDLDHWLQVWMVRLVMGPGRTGWCSRRPLAFVPDGL